MKCRVSFFQQMIHPKRRRSNTMDNTGLNQIEIYLRNFDMTFDKSGSFLSLPSFDYISHVSNLSCVLSQQWHSERRRFRPDC
ncbi:hypothetical protein LIER_39452 [Lithospermum erythrorhizon]|uniref:Uncharacterized protein n=1 Tax=Lithospermum erythrorhizon TaxID=34254 RepID=A0AAV3QHA2_LITER